MNPYQSPREADDGDEYTLTRSGPIPSNSFMAVFIAGAALLPLVVGSIFLMSTLMGVGRMPSSTRLILGVLAVLLLILGIGLMSAAIYLWRNRKMILEE